MSVYWNTNLNATYLWPPNSPLECTCSEFYRRTASIPILDYLLSEIESRFSSHQKTALLGLYLIPSILINNRLQDVIKKLGPLEKMFSDDLNDGSFSGELHQWYLKWESVKNNHGLDAIPTSLSYTLPHVLWYVTVSEKRAHFGKN